jgi:hypothetical protein
LGDQQRSWKLFFFWNPKLKTLFGSAFFVACDSHKPIDMLKKFQTKRGKEVPSSPTKDSPSGDESDKGEVSAGKGPLLCKAGWGGWKPYWFELSGDSLMQFNKRGGE